MAELTSRDRILDAACDLFIAEGYEHTTVARIRAKSGVSNGTLFHHFPTKEAILDALYTDAMKGVNRRYHEALASPPGSLRDLLRSVVGVILSFAVEEPDEAKIIYDLAPPGRESPSREELDLESAQLLKAIKNAMSPYRETGELKAMPDRAMMSILTGPAHLISQYWLSEPDQFPPPTNLIEVLADAALAGLTGSPTEGTHPPLPSASQVKIELVDQDGNSLGSGSGTIDLKQH